MKQFIPNRHNQKMSVLVEGPEVPGKLALAFPEIGIKNLGN
jgi:hypothetical protein